jgi:hypothetical protein
MFETAGKSAPSEGKDRVSTKVLAENFVTYAVTKVCRNFSVLNPASLRTLSDIDIGHGWNKD